MKNKVAVAIFFVFVSLSLLAPIWVFKDFLFPYITSKAFSFRIFIELAFPFYVYLLVSEKRYRPSLRNPLVLSMLTFLAISFIASFTGVNTNRSIWGNFERMGGAYYLTHLTLLALYVLLLAQAGGKYVQNILYVTLGVAAFVTLNGVFGWLGLPTVVKDASLPGRVSSTLGNPIFLGSFLIIPMFLSAFFASQTESLGKKIFFWAIAALFLGGIFLSVTRGAMIGLIAGIGLAAVIYALLHHKREVRIYGAAVILVGIVGLVGLFMSRQNLPQTGFFSRLTNLNDSNAKARFVQWRTALTGYKDYPLLGVGPENYYVIANKYYNIELMKYDPSWFDKPHNYILEVLVTTGAIGFLAYLSMIIFVFWSLFRAFKVGFVSLFQLCLLVAGFTSYLVQNLFVFDTIPASMTFYIFVGFAIYLWREASLALEVPAGGQGKKKLQTYTDSSALAMACFGVSAVVAIYAVYVTNVVPARAAKAVNYGYAYIGADVKQSNEYFQQAVNSTFNFDGQDTASRYSGLASAVAQSTTVDQDTAKNIVNDIVNFQEQVAKQIQNDPISWQKLSMDYYIKSVVEKTSLNPYVELYAKQAVALVPKRLEPSLQLAQVYMAENRPDDARKLLEQMKDTLPQINYTAVVSWTLASLDHSTGKDQEGLALVYGLLDQKFYPQSDRDIIWVLEYLHKEKNYPKLLEVSEQAVKALPNSADLYLILIQAYALNGQTQKAKDLANQALATNPPNKQAIEDLLKMIK